MSVRSLRRGGVGGRKCACGEDRPEALIRDSNPMICVACQRKQRGQTTFDLHHPAADANSPTKTPIWVNDHVAVLNVAQHDWPKTTLENPDRSPLLAAAGRNRGFIETNAYIVDALLRQNTEVLRSTGRLLGEKAGSEMVGGHRTGAICTEAPANIASRTQVTTPRATRSGSQ